jgi:hypothetical protein
VRCINKSTVFVVFLTVFCLLLVQGCEQKDNIALPLNVPRGYAKVLEIEINDRLIRFGPFVGYYFKPQTADDLSRLKFICFNELNFYTKDVPENTKLFKGDAVLTRLPEVNFEIPAADRINPIYFSDAPPQWLKSRPDPKDEFVHFHSCYDSQGAVLTGYWIRHEAAEAFTYDMGGRVGPSSPLYHKVMPGVDMAFARIIEFDQGPK